MGDISECPWKVLDKSDETAAALDAVSYYRDWEKGSLAATLPNCSDTMRTLILWVDDELGRFKAFLMKEADSSDRS